MPRHARIPAPIDVVAAVARRNHRWLVCQRPAGKRHGGQWEFPGGKVEELGLEEVTAGRVLHVVRPASGRLVLHFMEAVFAGEPRCLEHQALTWATYDDLCALDLAPGDRAFASTLAPART